METVTNLMNQYMMTQIADPQLRNVLISTAMNIEQMLKSGKITLSTPMAHSLPYGLRIEVAVEQKALDKPMLFTFRYSMDKQVFIQWMKENPYLTEGALSFNGKGIEIVVPIGDKKAEKIGFSIDDRNGERVWLPMFERPVTFHVHRDVFSGQEWDCSYVDKD